MSDDTYKDENNQETIREHDMLQVIFYPWNVTPISFYLWDDELINFFHQLQKKNLIRSIMEEREMIIDLKIQISMAQYKSRQPNLS